MLPCFKIHSPDASLEGVAFHRKQPRPIQKMYICQLPYLCQKQIYSRVNYWEEHC